MKSLGGIGGVDHYIKRSGQCRGVYRRWSFKHTSLLDSVQGSMGGGDSNVISFLLSGSP